MIRKVCHGQVGEAMLSLLHNNGLGIDALFLQVLH